MVSSVWGYSGEVIVRILIPLDWHFSISDSTSSNSNDLKIDRAVLSPIPSTHLSPSQQAPAIFSRLPNLASNLRIVTGPTPLALDNFNQREI